MVFGKRLRELRRERFMTLKEASEFLDIPPTTLSGYETKVRKPSIEVLAKIAEKYDCSTDYILGLSDDRDIKKVEDNIFEYFQKEGIHYKGYPLSEEELKPIASLLDVIIKERLPKKDNPEAHNHPKNDEREFYAL